MEITEKFRVYSVLRPIQGKDHEKLEIRIYPDNRFSVLYIRFKHKSNLLEEAVSFLNLDMKKLIH
jgi:hypothetical protein